MEEKNHANSCKKNSCTCDGYHTFDELYAHRVALFLALVSSHPSISWRAKKHSDGTMFDGWFVAGMRLPTGDITYHLPLSKWALLDGQDINVMDLAPEWDGHKSETVLVRIEEFIKYKK